MGREKMNSLLYGLRVIPNHYIPWSIENPKLDFRKYVNLEQRRFFKDGMEGAPSVSTEAEWSTGTNDVRNY